MLQDLVTEEEFALVGNLMIGPVKVVNVPLMLNGWIGTIGAVVVKLVAREKNIESGNVPLRHMEASPVLEVSLKIRI